MLDWVRRWAWGLSGRLIPSYILVTFAAVVLVEVVVLGFQVPSLANETQMQDQVEAFGLIFADTTAAHEFVAALKNAVILAKTQAMAR